MTTELFVFIPTRKSVWQHLDFTWKKREMQNNISWYLWVRAVHFLYFSKSYSKILCETSLLKGECCMVWLWFEHSASSIQYFSISFYHHRWYCLSYSQRCSAYNTCDLLISELLFLSEAVILISTGNIKSCLLNVLLEVLNLWAVYFILTWWRQIDPITMSRPAFCALKASFVLCWHCAVCAWSHSYVTAHSRQWLCQLVVYPLCKQCSVFFFVPQSPEEIDKEERPEVDAKKKSDEPGDDTDVFTQKHSENLFQRTEVLAGEAVLAKVYFTQIKWKTERIHIK